MKYPPGREDFLNPLTQTGILFLMPLLPSNYLEDMKIPEIARALDAQGVPSPQIHRITDCKVAILDHHLLRNLPILPNWCRPFSSHPLMSIWIQEHSTTQFMDFSVKMTSKRPNTASHDVNDRVRNMVFLDMFATSF